MDIVPLLTLLVSYLPTPFALFDPPAKNPGCDPAIHACSTTSEKADIEASIGFF